MTKQITEEQLDIEVKQTIAEYYEKNVYKRIDMIVNPAKRRIRFDVIDTDRNENLYSGQSLKQAMKIYNEVG